jgi:hypothetical protein
MTTVDRVSPPPPPRWAVRAAHVTALLTLPSGLWRLWLAAGHPAGYTEQGFAELGVTGWGVVYVVGLGVVTEALALLTLGLVRPWGEVVPRRVPVLGGRAVPARAVVVAAGLGAAALIALWTPQLIWWALPHEELTATGRLWIGVLYLPHVAWGPLLAAVTVSYHRRHTDTPGRTRGIRPARADRTPRADRQA